MTVPTFAVQVVSQNFTLPWNVKGMTFLYRIVNPGHRDSIGSSFKVILNTLQDTIAVKPECSLCNNPTQVSPPPISRT